jgi:hypothetical protein
MNRRTAGLRNADIGHTPSRVVASSNNLNHLTGLFLLKMAPSRLSLFLLAALALALFALPSAADAAKGPLVTKKVAFTIKQGDTEVRLDWIN